MAKAPIDGLSDTVLLLSGQQTIAKSENPARIEAE
jgi:hypothetical protein